MSREDEAAIANWTAGGRAPDTSGPTPRESLKVRLGFRGIGATTGATTWVRRGEGRAQGRGREAEILEPLRGRRGEGRAEGRRSKVVSWCKEPGLGSGLGFPP